MNEPREKGSTRKVSKPTRPALSSRDADGERKAEPRSCCNLHAAQLSEPLERGLPPDCPSSLANTLELDGAFPIHKKLWWCVALMSDV
jgi:hypothetical protein